MTVFTPSYAQSLQHSACSSMLVAILVSPCINYHCAVKSKPHPPETNNSSECDTEDEIERYVCNAERVIHRECINIL